MALEADTGASGLIRQVQKVLGNGSPAGAVRCRCSMAARDCDELEGLPPAWLAANARQALEFIADQAEGPPQAARPQCGRRRQRRHARRGDDRDPQRRHAVPGRLGGGRAAGARARRAPAAAPDLQDPARQGRPAAGDRRPRRPELERRAPGELHRHPLTKAMQDREARDLADALSAILAEVRVVVADWRADAGAPARGWRASWRWRRGSVPRDLLAEFDRRSCGGWRRTISRFLGSREYRARRRCRDWATSPPSRAAGSACCATQRAGAAPRHRAGCHDAGGAALLLRAGAAHHHQGQRDGPRAPARAHGLRRRQDLSPRRQRQRRGSLRRASSPRRPTCARRREIPLLRHKVDGVLAASRLSARQPRRQGAAQHAGHLPARRAVPDRRRAAAGMVRGHPRPRDPAARARVCARRPLRPVRVGARLCAARPLQHQGARAHRRPAGARPTRAASPRSIPTSPKARWCGCSSSSAATRARRRTWRSASWSAGSPTIVRTWDDRLADAIAGTGDRVRGAARQVRRAPSRPDYAETFPAERALEDIERIERLGARQPVAIDFYREPGDAGRPHPRRRLSASAARSACRERVPVLENLGFSRHRRALLPASARALPTGEREVTLHDMVLETDDGAPIELGGHDKRLEACFLAVLPRRGRQRQLQPAGRLGAAPTGARRRRSGLCRLSAPARLAVRAALHRRHARTATPASRAICSSCSTCASIPTAGSTPSERRGGRGADPRAHRGRARRRAEPGRGPHPAPGAQPHRSHGAHQFLPDATRSGRLPAPRLPSSSTARRWRRRRSRGRSARSGSTRRAWRASTCASRRSPAAASAGRTGRRTSAPRCWAWCAPSSSRTP